MRKTILLMAVIAMLGSTTAFAQKKDKDFKRYERAEARKLEPEIRTFVTPQICDMQMLSKGRETYGPYTFPINSIEETFNYEIKNFQNRVLYRACQEADADAMIEPIFKPQYMTGTPRRLSSSCRLIRCGMSTSVRHRKRRLT